MHPAGIHQPIMIKTHRIRLTASIRAALLASVVSSLFFTNAGSRPAAMNTCN
jgi:hypothetical protein